ncbi:serine/threonine-protein kinase [Actinocorallia sp. A-T 12471]|uniref:serine/threonine-protein kinase n=1 Tax=Actinocorallia sp. A-T 12471 TaxID=3089813 RepID=UPI0029D3AF01|nr:serine/threonine-protein kinase [Actinocorallia sp. A-T 12471]MDX6742804.1 serine/threonine-protein kinase [Actinocorallia sp. A-T 12471]
MGVPGRPVAGRYLLEEPLGQGGMGSVWRARDLALDRPVALKEIHLGQTRTKAELETALARVRREARAAARIRHPNVVVVHDYVEGRPPDDGPWIVMELVEGRTLSDVLDASPGGLPERDAAVIGRAVLNALTAIHGQGVVHRDVKPANVILRDSSDDLGAAVCLVDFGTATITGYRTITVKELIGTPHFMAPERFTSAAGPASDLWSLGVLLYVLIEARYPFPGRTFGEIAASVHRDPPLPTTNAHLLRPLLTALLTKSPTTRLPAPAASLLLTAATHPPQPNPQLPPPTPPPEPDPPKPTPQPTATRDPVAVILDKVFGGIAPTHPHPTPGPAPAPAPAPGPGPSPGQGPDQGPRPTLGP